MHSNNRPVMLLNLLFLERQRSDERNMESFFNGHKYFPELKQLSTLIWGFYFLVESSRSCCTIAKVQFLQSAESCWSALQSPLGTLLSTNSESRTLPGILPKESPIHENILDLRLSGYLLEGRKRRLEDHGNRKIKNGSCIFFIPLKWEIVIFLFCWERLSFS